MVDVDRDAGLLESRQADPKGALDEPGPFLRRSIADERGHGRIGDGEPVDDEAIAVDTDRMDGLQ